MDFSELVRIRKSVRKFSDRPVEDKVIESILEAARLAPSWKNSQCWQFVVIRNRDTIVELAKLGGTINRWYKDAPVMIAGCADPTLSGEHHELPYYLVDFAIAMEHLVLAAADQGLGSCWIGIFDEKHAKQVLRVPDPLRIVALTPIGYPAKREGIREVLTKAALGRNNRKPLEQIVHFEHF